MTQDLAALVAQATPGPWTDEILTHTDPNGDDYPCDVEVSNGAGRHIHGHDLGYDGDVDLEILANARLIAMAPDLARTVLEQQAEIARLTARAENAEAALSEIQALLAMAFEVAAHEVRGSNLGLTIGDVADDVLALTPADAQAALDARINAAKEEGRVLGLREGVECCTTVIDHNLELSIQTGAYRCKEAILSKIKEAENG